MLGKEHKTPSIRRGQSMDTIHTANPLDLTPKSKTVPENICLLHKMTKESLLRSRLKKREILAKVAAPTRNFDFTQR
jgi:hypothetical protein